MADPYLCEVRLMAFNYAPRGWALCNGQTLLISQNQALFALLGTFYGGNGVQNFLLPNLQGRVALHFGGSTPNQGQSAGEAVHTLTAQELPAHSHSPMADSGGASTNILTGHTFANSGAVNAYGGTVNLTAMASATTSVGGSGAHENRMPFTVINFCMALQGIFPSRN